MPNKSASPYEETPASDDSRRDESFIATKKIRSDDLRRVNLEFIGDDPRGQKPRDLAGKLLSFNELKHLFFSKSVSKKNEKVNLIEERFMAPNKQGSMPREYSVRNLKSSNEGQATSMCDLVDMIKQSVPQTEFLQWMNGPPVALLDIDLVVRNTEFMLGQFLSEESATAIEGLQCLQFDPSSLTLLDRLATVAHCPP